MKDFTFDLALNDAKKATATTTVTKDIRTGVELFTYIKTAVNVALRQRLKWDKYIDWRLVDSVYCKVYGQSPLIKKWYWKAMLGLPVETSSYPTDFLLEVKAERARDNRKFLQTC